MTVKKTDESKNAQQKNGIAEDAAPVPAGSAKAGEIGSASIVPEVPMPELPSSDVPRTPVPETTYMAQVADMPPEPLSEREKHLVNLATKQVLNQIDPLLIKLQQISNEAVSMGASQKLQELERGINERIESRIHKINALIGRRGG